MIVSNARHSFEGAFEHERMTQFTLLKMVRVIVCQFAEFLHE